MVFSGKHLYFGIFVHPVKNFPPEGAESLKNDNNKTPPWDVKRNDP